MHVFTFFIRLIFIAWMDCSINTSTKNITSSRLRLESFKGSLYSSATLSVPHSIRAITFRNAPPYKYCYLFLDLRWRELLVNLWLFETLIVIRNRSFWFGSPWQVRFSGFWIAILNRRPAMSNGTSPTYPARVELPPTRVKWDIPNWNRCWHDSVAYWMHRRYMLLSVCAIVFLISIFFLILPC